MKRPHIPLEVRCVVAARQICGNNRAADNIVDGFRAVGFTTTTLLGHLRRILAVRIGCEVDELRLDHEPAIALRTRDSAGNFTPHANDPDYLIYRSEHAHHIKTNVRGDGAQYSDTVLMKRERKRIKKDAGKKHKYNWSKGRKLQGRSSW